MDPVFDTEINDDYHENKFGTIASLASDVMGGTVATVVDAGASLWNSLPFTPEASTADLLSGISDNALRVYQENEDTIHTASFIAGSFVPGGLAVKGLNAMRAGVKTANWFSTAGKVESLAKVEKLFAEGAGATASYRNAVRGIYAKTAVNQAIDAAAFEVFALTAFKAHPFVEDYMKDPATNFGISVLLGGALGGAVGAIADSHVIKEKTGSIMAGAIEYILGKATPISPTAPEASKLMAAANNAQLFAGMIESRTAAGMTEANDLVTSLATKLRTMADAETNSLFKGMASSEITALPESVQEIIKQRIAQSPEMLGVETVRAITPKDLEVTNITKLGKASPLTAAPDLMQTVSSKGPIAPRAISSVWYPGQGFGTLDDAADLVGAVVLGKTPEQFAKALPFSFGRVPNLDGSLELLGKSAADIQAGYIAAVEKVDKMTVKQIAALNLSISDGPLLTAVLARASKDPEVAALAMSVFDKTPIYKKVMEHKTEELIAAGTIQKTGPTPTYQKAIDAFAGPGQIDQFRPRGGAVTIADGNAIEKWIGGGLLPFREAYTYYQAFKTAKLGGISAQWGTKGLKPDELAVAMKKADMMARLIDSPQSEALRAKFRALADADGNVFLYRGMHGVARGHSSVASYTTYPSKGAQFGSVGLYKVHVDDILMGFEDVGSGKFNAEILVAAGARSDESVGAATAAASTPGARVTNVTTTTTTEVEGKAVKNIAEIRQLLIEQKREAIDALLAVGAPMDSIALKTNTPVGIVTAYATGAEKSDVALYIAAQGDLGSMSIVKDTESFANVLDKANQPLVLKGNMRKNAYTMAASSLNNKTLATINSEVTAASMFSSTNPYVRRAAEFTFGDGKDPESVRWLLDSIKSVLAQGNNAQAGNAFINSFDFFTRNMGHLGPAISNVGRKWERLRNEFITEINEPLAGFMSKLSMSKAETIEFNTFREVNAGLGGWRAFKKSETTGEWNIVQKVEKVGEDGKKVMVLEPVSYQGRPYKVVSPNVIDTVNYIQEISPKLLSLANASKRILGAANVNDIGLWVPSFNPVNKFVAYVKGADDSTKILWANTAEEHQDLIKRYKAHIELNGTNERVIEKGVDQAEWSRANNRVDPIHMKQANTALQKSGSSASADIRTDAQVFGEIAGGYEHYINAEMRQLADLAMSDVTDQLSKMSKLNRGSFDSQPLSLVKKITDAPKDAAATLHNTLLGNPNLGEYEGWKSINQSFESGLSMGVSAVASIWKNTADPLIRSITGRARTLTPAAIAKADYEKVMKEMKDKGIVIWDGFDTAAAKERGFSRLEDSPDISKRIVYASNALAATMMLRVGELAQPLVNMMSLPILTALAAGSKMPETFMGIQKSTANVSAVQIMYEGMRASHSKQFAKLEQRWIADGYFESVVSEANKSLGSARSMNKGMIPAIENMLDSSIVKVLSKGADLSEEIVRRQTMFTGAVLAKRLYPELSDAGVTVFARDFMDKAVGNFEAAQRPVFFQGTLGVALGLFQTYSVTLAQHMYRQLELKNYKTLAKAMLTQSTIFGSSSMPGFNPVSQLIGEHFSDDHYDLVTGTYRALPDTAAQAVLYGLPSLAGAGIHTRGDSNFRAPGLDGVVAINAANQITQAVTGVARSLGEGENAWHATMQALSLQNISRPLARTAEIATGYSVTRQGNTVQTPEEVWTTTGIMSRVLGVRPVEETKLREMMHLNSYYGSIDRDNRQSLMIKLRNDIRAGTLTDDLIESYGEEYMRKGGSPTGWRSAVATAIGRTSTAGKETLLEKLKPTSPFMHMMDQLD